MKNQESKTSTSKNSDKVIAIKVDARTHELVKSLAKFKGIKIQDLGNEALIEYIEYTIQHDLKEDVADLRQRIRAANAIINPK
jgi:hypothetical protein